MSKIKFFIGSAILIFADQISKFIIINSKTILPKTIIKDVLDITYCENRGIAFGLADGHVQVIAIITLVVLVAICCCLLKNFNKINKISALGACLMLSGGVGNLLDRACRSYVIDFIDFGRLLQFPVFNLADIFVVMGVLIIGVSFFIFNRGELNEEDKC